MSSVLVALYETTLQLNPETDCVITSSPWKIIPWSSSTDRPAINENYCSVSNTAKNGCINKKILQPELSLLKIYSLCPLACFINGSPLLLLYLQLSHQVCVILSHPLIGGFRTTLSRIDVFKTSDLNSRLKNDSLCTIFLSHTEITLTLLRCKTVQSSLMEQLLTCFTCLLSNHMHSSYFSHGYLQCSKSSREGYVCITMLAILQMFSEIICVFLTINKTSCTAS